MLIEKMHPNYTHTHTHVYIYTVSVHLFVEHSMYINSYKNIDKT